MYGRVTCQKETRHFSAITVPFGRTRGQFIRPAFVFDCHEDAMRNPSCSRTTWQPIPASNLLSEYSVLRAIHSAIIHSIFIDPRSHLDNNSQDDSKKISGSRTT